MLAVAVLVAGNVLIVYASVVMLQDQTRDRLRYWIGTVAVMVAVDMFIVEPLEVFWFHWIQPYCGGGCHICYAHHDAEHPAAILRRAQSRARPQSARRNHHDANCTSPAAVPHPALADA